MLMGALLRESAPTHYAESILVQTIKSFVGEVVNIEYGVGAQEHEIINVDLSSRTFQSVSLADHELHSFRLDRVDLIWIGMVTTIFYE